VKEMLTPRAPAFVIKSSLSEITGKSKSTTTASARICASCATGLDSALRVQYQISRKEHRAQAILRKIAIVNPDFTQLLAARLSRRRRGSDGRTSFVNRMECAESGLAGVTSGVQLVIWSVDLKCRVRTTAKSTKQPHERAYPYTGFDLVLPRIARTHRDGIFVRLPALPFMPP
jgi:hypothetical protein